MEKKGKIKLGSIFGFIATPFGYLIEFCYKLIPNYAIALLLFALIMKIVLFPLSIKQQKNTVKQAKLRPKEMAIRNRYAGRTDKVTQQKMQQEVMKLYQDENYNPASGCLPLILQLIIVFAVYSVVMNPLCYVCHVSQDRINNVNTKVVEMYREDEKTHKRALVTDGLSDNLVKKLESNLKNLDKKKKDGEKDKFSSSISGIELVNILRVNDINDFKDGSDGDKLLPKDFKSEKLPDFKLFGGKFDLAGTPSLSNPDWLWVMPVLTFIFTFGSMKLTKKFTYQPPQQGDAAMSMKFMDFTMPLISTFFTFQVPAIVALYWIYQNIFSVLQQAVLKMMFPYPEFTEAEYKEAEREMNKGIKADKKTKKKAGIPAHRIDLDDDTPTEDTSPDGKSLEAGTDNAVSKKSDFVAPAKLKDESDKPKD